MYLLSYSKRNDMFHISHIKDLIKNNFDKFKKWIKEDESPDDFLIMAYSRSEDDLMQLVKELKLKYDLEKDVLF